MFEKILELCNKKGITIAKLEKECGFGNATIRGWKTSSPNFNNLKKVSDYLGVPITYFLEDNTEKVQ